MSRQAQAAALREQLSKESPEMLAFMEDLKANCGAVVLHVKTQTIEAGKEPSTGVVPHVPLPDKVWPYEVGKSPSSLKRK